MKKPPIFLLLAILNSNLIFSQELTVKYTQELIEIDGSPSDLAWNDAESSTDFWQWMPTDSVRAVKQTEFKALFDNENLYFLVKAYTKEKKFTVYNLERDFETKSADYVQLIFDTFNDASNAFKFQTNHLGLKGDMLLSSVNSFGGRGMNSSWDAIWEVESKLYDDSYIVELKIPLDQLYFINGAKLEV
ncbi:MAG: carbohydrate binding family 9 domain-containing protein [Flavobacteriales bacterium]|nr:carbohydrate binding family 9 domain-containing protein [Flavobacteriales bacterium]